jgi:hypothetical protein
MATRNYKRKVRVLDADAIERFQKLKYDRRCACCGNGDGAFGFGGVPPRFLLCATCWLLTPSGQSQMLQIARKLNDEVSTGTTVAHDDEAAGAAD